jgi:hypothetical protein
MQAGKTTTHDADVYVEIEGQPRTLGRRRGGFRIPACAAGDWVVCCHQFLLSDQR